MGSAQKIIIKKVLFVIFFTIEPQTFNNYYHLYRMQFLSYFNYYYDDDSIEIVSFIIWPVRWLSSLSQKVSPDLTTGHLVWALNRCVVLCSTHQSKYRESDLRADDSLRFRINLAVLWCQAAIRTHLFLLTRNPQFGYIFSSVIMTTYVYFQFFFFFNEQNMEVLIFWVN